MNIFSGSQNQRLGWLIILLLFQFGSAFAQSDVYYQPTIQAQKGYWRLNMSLDKRNTIVSFFDHQDQLLYEETLSGYYLNPTQRTTELLDDFLGRLTTNRLVSTQLQSQLVPLPVFEKQLKRSIDSEQSETTSLDIKNRIHCSINPNGIIRLNVLNPAAEQLAIRLADERGRTLYQNATNQKEYYSRLDVSTLENGHFRLSVLDVRGKELYTFQLVKSTHAQFDLQAISQPTYATVRAY